MRSKRRSDDYENDLGVNVMSGDFHEENQESGFNHEKGSNKKKKKMKEGSGLNKKKRNDGEHVHEGTESIHLNLEVKLNKKKRKLMKTSEDRIGIDLIGEEINKKDKDSSKTLLAEKSKFSADRRSKRRSADSENETRLNLSTDFHEDNKDSGSSDKKGSLKKVKKMKEGSGLSKKRNNAENEVEGKNFPLNPEVIQNKKKRKLTKASEDRIVIKLKEAKMKKKDRKKTPLNEKPACSESKLKETDSEETQRAERNEMYESQVEGPYQIPGVDEDCTMGMKKWLLEYHSSKPGLEVLKRQNDDWLIKYEAQKQKEREEREAQAAEGGWTVVKHQKGRKKTTDAESGIAVGSVSEAAVLEKVANKKNKGLAENFYRFQRREAQRNELMLLQSKFAQQKKRIQQLKDARKFRPFG